MKHYLYPRPFHVLQRASGSLVSPVRRCSRSHFFSSPSSPHCGPRLFHPDRKPADHTYRRIFEERSYPITPIQTA
jgi:hypothetical protein